MTNGTGDSSPKQSFKVVINQIIVEKGKETSREMQWNCDDGSILQLAEKNGIYIVNCCRKGYDEVCRSWLESGSVRHLIEHDVGLAEDEFLPCIAVPASDIVFVANARLMTDEELAHAKKIEHPGDVQEEDAGPENSET